MIVGLYEYDKPDEIKLLHNQVVNLTRSILLI